MLTRWKITLSGRVQGIGLRFRAKMGAQQYKITGWIRNLDNGDVELEIQGEEYAVDSYVNHIRTLPGVQVSYMHADELDVIAEDRFRIR